MKQASIKALFFGFHIVFEDGGVPEKYRILLEFTELYR
jgi:hypothetical protein